MKQIVNSNIDSNWPGIEIDFHKKIEFFIDNLNGFNDKSNTYKIFYLREPDTVTNIKNTIIENKNLFDAIITFDSDVLKSCENSHLLEFGTTWVHDYVFPVKQFRISHLTGNKNLTDGHKLRQEIYFKQNKITQDKDFYISHNWNVDNIFNNKILYDKKEPLFNSQFHICIENTKIENYFTEKLIDCLITKTIPIYYGCKNIENYFDTNGFIICNNAKEIIEKSNSINDNLYKSKLESINKNYELSKNYINLPQRLKELINKITKDEFSKSAQTR